MSGISRRALLKRLLPVASPAPKLEPKIESAPESSPRFVVRVDRHRCITFQGPECGACAGLCPGDEQAMGIRRFRPEFAVESCAGCGRCVAACPMIPSALAMELLPRPATDEPEAPRPEAPRAAGATGAAGT